MKRELRSANPRGFGLTTNLLNQFIEADQNLVRVSKDNTVDISGALTFELSIKICISVG